MKTDVTGGYRRKANAFEITVMVLFAVLFLAVFVLDVVFFDDTNAEKATSCILTLIALILAMTLFGFCLGGFTWDERQKLFFECIVISFYLACLMEALYASFSSLVRDAWVLNVFDNLLYVLTAAYWLSFWFFQKDKFEYPIGPQYVEGAFIVFFSLYALVAFINMLTGFDFESDANGNITLKGYFIPIMTVLWFAIYFLIVLLGKSDKKTKWTLLSYSVFPASYYILMLVFQDDSFMMGIATSLGCIFYLIPLYLLFFNIYMERGKLLLLNERELEKSRANVMALQINPHFIANTMGSIVALCDPAAPEAADLAAKFAKYLRDNYVNMSSEHLILFSEEMEHVKNYLAVEKVRFPHLSDEYDCALNAFLIPTLTVQTLIENAVRHGIQKKKDARGTVKVRTFEDDKNYVVEIIDDGVGFDPNAAPKDDRAHIGIENVKARLKILCGGDLEIKSTVGVGTTCRVFVPKPTGGG